MARPILITAGATRNPIDAMRYISARSSGSTGAAIANALVDSRPVTVLGSPEALLRLAPGVQQLAYGSTRDLMAKMEAWVRANPRGVVLHASAVGDYEARPDAGKIPSGLDELVITLTRTPKIADQVKEWSAEVFLITFKAAGPETTGEQLVDICRRQLTRTSSDLVVGNVNGSLQSTTTLVYPERARAYPARSDALDALIARLRSIE